VDTTFGLLNVKSEACRERAICELEKTATQNVVTAFLTKNLKWVWHYTSVFSTYIFRLDRYPLRFECWILYWNLVTIVNWKEQLNRNNFRAEIGCVLITQKNLRKFEFQLRFIFYYISIQNSRFKSWGSTSHLEAPSVGDIFTILTGRLNYVLKVA
jgi:hypothetical protein